MMTTEERFERMEKLMDRVLEAQLQVDTTMITLADSHIKTQEDIRELVRRMNQLSAQQAETGRQLQAYLTRVPPQ